MTWRRSDTHPLSIGAVVGILIKLTEPSQSLTLHCALIADTVNRLVKTVRLICFFRHISRHASAAHCLPHELEYCAPVLKNNFLPRPLAHLLEVDSAKA